MRAAFLVSLTASLLGNRIQAKYSSCTSFTTTNDQPSKWTSHHTWSSETIYPISKPNNGTVTQTPISGSTTPPSSWSTDTPGSSSSKGDHTTSSSTNTPTVHPSSTPGNSTSVTSSSTNTPTVHSSSTSSNHTSATSTSSTRSSSTTSSTTSPTACRTPLLLIDDFSDAWRFEQLERNSLGLSTGLFTSFNYYMFRVANNRAVFRNDIKEGRTWGNTLGCRNITAEGYDGISFRIKAFPGTVFPVGLVANDECTGGSVKITRWELTTEELGWVFDGTEKLYTIQFQKFIDHFGGTYVLEALQSFDLIDLIEPMTVGPQALYCGTTPSEWPAPPEIEDPPVIPAHVLDTFENPEINFHSFPHGADNPNMNLTWGRSWLTIQSSNPDYAFFTQTSTECDNWGPYESMFLRIGCSGSKDFTIAVSWSGGCNDATLPWPESWTSLKASWYATNDGYIYIPISHFKIRHPFNAVSVIIKGISDPLARFTLHRIDIVRTIPPRIPNPTGPPINNDVPLIRQCDRAIQPYRVALGIDDGEPALLTDILDTLRTEGVKATFFVLGSQLTTNPALISIYQRALAEGHQLAHHFYRHIQPESKQFSPDDIDNNVRALSDNFGVESLYWRPPYGSEGAVSRNLLGLHVLDAMLVTWSINLEERGWGVGSDLDADLDVLEDQLLRGGNLISLHATTPAVVKNLGTIIRRIRARGYRLVRVDQCLLDPQAPPIIG